MTYCKEDMQYIDKVKATLSSSNLNYIIFDSYMSEIHVAKLRLISDIFVNAQTTDAFCNTVKEFFYLEKVIFNPIWLNYPEFKEWDLKTISYLDFSEIPTTLLNYHGLITKEQLQSNSAFFKDKMSWNSCKDKWNKIYNSFFISKI